MPKYTIFQAEIKDVLDKICSVLPGSYKQEVRKFRI